MSNINGHQHDKIPSAGEPGQTEEAPATHPIGRVQVSRLFLRDWKKALEVMSHILVMDARFLPDRDAMEYMGLSDMFAEIPFGQIAPLYEIKVMQDADQFKYVAVEIDPTKTSSIITP